MKKVRAILIWGVLIFAIGTFLDKVRGMLMQGSDPGATAFFQFAVGFVLVVAVVLMGRWLRGRMGSKGMGPGEWFFAGAVAWALQGAFVWWGERPRTLDLQIHETMFVIYYLHVALAVAVVFGVMGAVYLAFPLVTRRAVGRVFGLVHFWVSFGALYVVLWMESYTYVNVSSGRWGFALWWRYAQWETTRMADWAYTGLAMLLVAVQLVFVASLVWAVLRPGKLGSG